jgi:hypothetical protein
MDNPLFVLDSTAVINHLNHIFDVDKFIVNARVSATVLDLAGNVTGADALRGIGVYFHVPGNYQVWKKF